MFSVVNAIDWVRSTQLYGFFSERVPIINDAAASAKGVAGTLDEKISTVTKKMTKTGEEALAAGKTTIADISQKAAATQKLATQRASSAVNYIRAVLTGALLTVVLYIEQISPTLKSYTQGDSPITRYAILVSIVLMIVYVLDQAAKLIRRFISAAAEKKKRH